MIMMHEVSCVASSPDPPDMERARGAHPVQGSQTNGLIFATKEARRDHFATWSSLQTISGARCAPSPAYPKKRHVSACTCVRDADDAHATFPAPSSSLQSIAMKLLVAALAGVAAQHAAAFAPVATVGRSFSGATTGLRMAEAPAALSQDELKQMVGYKSVDDYVKSGMVVGLGTGSTAYFAVERLGQLLESGELTDIVAIPTSVRTKEQAEELKIPLVTLDTHSKLDVAIDGADEVDPDLNLVKGGGGALLREKMVEVCADKFIVIVDESKLCDGLGPGFACPWRSRPSATSTRSGPSRRSRRARAATPCSGWAPAAPTSRTATRSRSRTTATTSLTCTSRKRSRMRQRWPRS